ncbi:uncharacterized protein LOC110843782 isoform X2 [Folsomia candida]|uniref:uncharacterized protein LOC110843782 isoform X2 n=1 Tax=Folsomia candida TaxID=158441 RepID=UPI001604C533|nr:uncharacterized protein LOC110843782 isoform X2 [Folsomia candida]
MGQQKEIKAFILLGLICISTIMPALAAPNNARKFAVKNNSPKKVYHKNIAPSKDNIDRTDRDQQQTMMMNKQSEALGAPPSNEMMMGPNGSPANMIWAVAAPIVQLLKVFLAGPNELDGNGLTPGDDKMDGPGFSWGQVIGYGMKLLLAALGGNSNGNVPDGIDKMGVGESPMQGVVDRLLGALTGNENEGNAQMVNQTREFIKLAMSLINAMQSSINQRSMRARSLGEKDRMADAALASLYMSKAFVKSFNTTQEQCREQLLCESARECVDNIGSSSAFGFCHLTAFATTNLMYYTHAGKKDMTKAYLEATRRGRSHENCKTNYQCNEINLN